MSSSDELDTFDRKLAIAQRRINSYEDEMNRLEKEYIAKVYSFESTIDKMKTKTEAQNRDLESLRKSFIQ